MRLLFIVTILAGCRPGGIATSPTLTSPQTEYWRSLASLCGNSFLGRVIESSPPDTVMSRQVLHMHVRECSRDTLRIPFHVGPDRSRTWVLTPTATGLRLKHDHRHEDGSEDRVTQYGGDTRGTGSATHQEFFADDHTATLIPAARTNVWTIAVVPGERFVYALRREGSERRFRVEFDLKRPVAPPPPPWGAKR